MRNFRIFALPVLALLCASCCRGVKVKGEISGLPDTDIVVKVLNVNVYDVLDTVRTSPDGSFRFRVPVKDGQPEFVYVFRGERRIASLLVEKGEKPFVRADSLGNFSVEGSEGSALLADVERDYAGFISGMESSNDSRELSKLYVSYYRSRIEYLMKHTFSLTCVPVLFQEFGDGVPVFSQLTDAVQFRTVCDSLKRRYPESRYVAALEKETVARENRLSLQTRLQSAEPVGFPDIVMPDMNGENRSLREVDAKVILLHFWTSQDPAQKMVNLEILKPLYEKYHPRGFEIYSVCIDPDKVGWAASVKAQELPWINVNDGKGAATQSLSVFGITELPSSLVISDGEVLRSSLRGADELENYLRKLLK